MKKDEQKEVQTPEYPHESLQLIEDTRKEFWKKYQLHNTLKFFVTVVCFLVILAAIILKNKLPGGDKSWIVLVVAILALGLAYGYALYVRKKFDRKMKTYFELYFSSINAYAMSGKAFSDVELQKPGKITVEEFNECLLYKDVFEAGSRGLTTYKFNKVEMSVVDCAGNIKDAKRVRPVFVGKMVRAKAAYKGATPIIVYIKGNERALPPTNLEGIKAQEEDKKMVVYSNYKDYNKVLTGEVRKALEAIKTETVLVDVAISIYKGKVFIMMGYDDPLMVLPLQTTFNSKPTEKYKKDIEAVGKLVEALNK